MFLITMVITIASYIIRNKSWEMSLDMTQILHKILIIVMERHGEIKHFVIDILVCILSSSPFGSSSKNWYS